MGPARGEPDHHEAARKAHRDMVPQWGRLVESRITPCARLPLTSSNMPQWGRLVESRITGVTRHYYYWPGTGAAMGPARGEPDHERDQNIIYKKIRLMPQWGRLVESRIT